MDRRTLLAETLTTIIGMSFALYQSYKPDPLKPVWEVSEGEIRLLGDRADQCFDLLPETIVEKAVDWCAPAALVFATVMVVGPRIQQERAIINEFRMAAQAQAGIGRPFNPGNAGQGASENNGNAVPRRPGPWIDTSDTPVGEAIP